MKTINRSELLSILRDIRHATPITISALTEAKVNKTAICEWVKMADRSILIPTGYAGRNAFNALSPAARANKVLVDNPWEEVRKVNKINGFTGATYENSVNRARAKEEKPETFTVGERAWGNRVSPALVELDGKYYLPIQPRHTGRPIYFARKIGDMLRQVPKDSIAAFLPPPRENTRQKLDHEVIYRNYSLDNIVAVNLNGESYRIRD